MNLDQVVANELSGSVAKSYVAGITRYHRIQGSPMFHEAAEHVKAELKKMGIKDVRIEQYPADGKHAYWTYTSPIGWEAREAELTMVEPENKLLASYHDIPQSLHTFSKGTSKDGVTAELVDVGSGVADEDYKGKKVKGRIVLATGRATVVHEQAVERRGAVGIITDSMPYEFPGVRESIDVPDAHAYQGLWPTSKNLRKLAFGFSLSKRQGNQLRKLLRSGKAVKLKAVVDARLFPGHEDVVTAVIKGSERPGEEVFVVGHLCHPKPGANDNASGSGAMLEVARTITSLMRSGKIKRPRRTIRFLWVPETLGTVAYLAGHDDIPQRFLAGINLDMVGEDQDACGSTLNMTKTPDSLPSFLNDYMADVFHRSLRSVDPQVAVGLATKFRFSVGTFSAGSDHAEFTTSTTRVPCVSFTQWPDKYYHTSMDTIDRVSEDSLRRIGWIATVGTLELANADPEQVLLMIALTASNGAMRIKEAGADAARKLIETARNPKAMGKRDLAKELSRIHVEAKSQIAHAERREKDAVVSALVFGTDKRTNSLARRCQGEIGVIASQEISKLDEILRHVAESTQLTIPEKVPDSKAVRELKRLVPKKMFNGTLFGDLLKERIGRKESEAIAKMSDKDRDFDNKAVEVLNFMDGKRTGAEILESVSSEFGRTDADDLLRLLKDLKKAKLIELV
jgi:hypothetical protein